MIHELPSATCQATKLFGEDVFRNVVPRCHREERARCLPGIEIFLCQRTRKAGLRLAVAGKWLGPVCSPTERSLDLDMKCSLTGVPCRSHP